MNKSQSYGAVDRFRIIAAVLIVSIHTYPLLTFSSEANFIFVNIFSRIAVPFFLIITGFFLLPQYIKDTHCISNQKINNQPLFKFLKKICLLYLVSCIVFIPISIYAGYYSADNWLITFIRNLVFDGIFYHLWYLPGVILGVILVYLLGRVFQLKALIYIACFLYLVGLFGDSYFGIVGNIPILNGVYSAMFHIFSYTRNGIFYVPIFLLIGCFIRKMPNLPTKNLSLILFTVSMLMMLVEGFLLQSYILMRHDSMYVFLVPSTFFLFCYLLNLKGNSSYFLRDVSLWIFILHPVFIILIRGVARFAGLTELLVNNNLIHFFIVCLSTCIFSIIIAKVNILIKQKISSNNL